MMRYLSKSLLLMSLAVILCCVIYPLVLWAIGQTIFPFQANGSLIRGPDGKLVGSRLIAQPFTRDEYFRPRPSAASYDASASASSSLAASNYALRDRVARALGPMVRHRGGLKPGQLVAPDIVRWFGEDRYQGRPHIVAQWAALHPALAEAWRKDHPGPGLAFAASDVPAVFFDMWRQDHPEAELESVPADQVTTSASGLDPHITLQNAELQLDRVVAGWAAKLGRDASAVRGEIEQLLQANASAPFYGLAGEKIVNVLEVNLWLRKRYGPPT